MVGGGLVRPGRDLELEERAAIEKALEECADGARSEILLKYFKDGRPTREECQEVVGMDPRGQPITRAMRLRREQHEMALRCAEEKLSKIKPGGFSLSPRYRFDPKTRRTEYIPREAVEELLRQGRGAELRGTIEPDIVIHEGDPRRIQDVYDFKFPCMATDQRAPWRRYPEGHPYQHEHQGEVYQEALGRLPARVQPHVGAFR